MEGSVPMSATLKGRAITNLSSSAGLQLSVVARGLSPAISRSAGCRTCETTARCAAPRPVPCRAPPAANLAAVIEDDLFGQAHPEPALKELAARLHVLGKQIDVVQVLGRDAMGYIA